MKNQTQPTDLYHVMGKLESQIHNVTDGQQDMKVSLERMQRRLMTIERQHSFLRGSVAALLTVGAIFGALIDHVIRWFMGR